MTDNVVNFPNSKANVFPASIEESLDHIDVVRKEYCDEVAEDAVEAVFAVFSSYGIFVKPNEESVKNIVFMEESIKSLLYSLKKVTHSFQEIAENVITIDGEAREEMDRIIEENS
jgi:hypothetical protein